MSTQTPSNSVEDAPNGINELAAKISRYFLDFLETDFKKQKAPRRKIQIKNDSGFLTGLPIRKYRNLYDVVWNLLSTPINEITDLRVRRGRYIAPISPALRDLIAQHANSLEASAFEQVRNETIEYARQKRGQSIEDPEQYVEGVQTCLVESVSKNIIAPILALLDGPFRQQSYSAIESVYEIETDLVETLTTPSLTQLPATLNTFIVSSDFGPTTKVLDDFFSEKEIKERIKSFFDDFATADAFQELRDLTHYMRLGGESLQVYLYVCDLRFGTNSYPVFYIPVNVTLDEKNGDLVVELLPHLYIHKRAIDFIVQEQGSTAQQLALSPIKERIIYINPKKSFVDEMHSVLVKMLTTFDLSGAFDIRVSKIETSASSNVRLSKAAYFAVFDRGDESLLNDYEALLTTINDDHKGVSGLFKNIIQGFLLDEPVSVRETVSDQWDKTDIPNRLVSVSPIPLNEEQRKVLLALNDASCRYITIQGPPGTGKSHTITAIAFDCILKNKNILILSDKQEALDVVEGKLKSALASVRQDSNFPDPILRLGKTGNTYTRLISPSSQEQIRNHYRAARGQVDNLSMETNSTNRDILKAIKSTVDAYSAISLSEIGRLHLLEKEVEEINPGCVPILQASDNANISKQLGLALANEPNLDKAISFISNQFGNKSFADLLDLAQAYSIADKIRDLKKHRSSMVLFDSLGLSDQQTLQKFIIEYEEIKMPVFGYLFKGSEIRELNQKVGQTLLCANSLDLQNRLADLKVVNEILVVIRQAVKDNNLDDEIGRIIYWILKQEDELNWEADPIRTLFETFHKVFNNNQDYLTRLGADDKNTTRVDKLLRFVVLGSRYLVLWNFVRSTLSSAPHFDYVGTKSKLEKLHTTRMTHEIDRKFIEFVENNRATAKTLGGVIKAKQQFPQDAFEGLKNAFPCIIAGIREFAEYVPLRQEIFDVVVIDEASQVSVAQAFPALLRAKKVVVLGDQMQFSNVKSVNASIALNQGYITDLEQHFRTNISAAADKLERLKQFDVKKSVLEFFELITNYTDMLRKHFRGYQELISFSSKYFYGGQLQAIKVRGKPIEEIIEFSFVDGAEKPERFKNINTPEAEFILERLKAMVDQEEGLTVGIITPFREQQQFLTKLIFADAYADQFEAELKLKIMTFDTCQGEERDVIIYSIVATKTSDMLNYIFPVSLDDASDRVLEAIRFQRLNVGFSRAKEKIHFVLSKQVDDFRGSIGRVLNHYKNILEDRDAPQASDTDPSSPMEQKVLDWITKTSFYQSNNDQLELFAQFPIGDYLRQLDNNYQHPAYRCDFLLRYYSDQTINIIVEYDGFQEHFINHNQIHVGNYDAYYRPEDIERQMILESYGYKFLRINRFNLGSDPISTLSERLNSLIAASYQTKDAIVVTQIQENVNDLNEGTAKHCRKCDQVKPKARFLDRRLNGGKGGYGQICLDCKTSGMRRKISYGSRRRF